MSSPFTRNGMKLFFVLTVTQSGVPLKNENLPPTFAIGIGVPSGPVHRGSFEREWNSPITSR